MTDEALQRPGAFEEYCARAAERGRYTPASEVLAGAEQGGAEAKSLIGVDSV